MTVVLEPRCGKRIRNWNLCGKPAGHSGNHLSEAAYRRALDRHAERRSQKRNVIRTHGYGGYTGGCRCETCTDAKADYMAMRRAGAFTAPPPETDPAVTHGTRFAYEERGCRCETCVTAERASSRYGRSGKGRAA